MSFKLTIVFATLAVVSCARLDNDQLSRQRQQQQELVQQQNEFVQQQNERIQEQQRIENEQRREQIRDLNEQSRRQEQMIREQQQERLDRIRSNENVFVAAQPQFVPTATVQLVTIPSSRRNFDLFDNSNYNFGYTVSDATTGDLKSQNEVRRGDQVQGQYTMMDADGYQRTVEYRADDRNGFDAEVRREPMRANQQVYASQYRYQQPTFQIVAAQQPTIFATTSVSRRDDGRRSQYSSTTSSNY